MNLYHGLWKLRPLAHQRGQLLASALFVVAFGAIGLRLMGDSSAATTVLSDVSYSLAPATLTIEKDQLVNISLNVDSAGPVGGEVATAVRYPTDQLSLISVRQVCPEPAFTETVQNVANVATGSIRVACTTKAARGGQSMASLTFRALTDAGSAALSLENGRANARGGSQAQLGASIGLEPRAQAQARTPRAVPDYASRKLCANPKPHTVRCAAEQAVNQDGSAIPSAAALVDGLGPKEWHQAYRLSCQPGGPVATICATPATYGPATVAIVIAGNHIGGITGLESDLRTYNQQFGLPPCTVANGCLVAMNQTGGPDLPETLGPEWSGELMLDVTAAHAVCQTCRIVVVQSDTAYSADMQTATRQALKLRPTAVSSSWVGGNWQTSPLSDFIAPGVGQFAANGDWGSGNTLIGDLRPSFPAEHPTVVSVSGTTLRTNADGTRLSETLWNASGGGCSPEASAMRWQQQLPNWGTAGCGQQRASGDIAAAGDPATGAALYIEGAWHVIGGTSLATPLMAAAFALANATVPANATVASVPYVNNNATNFFDITSGSNCTSTAKTKCSAAAGFDVPSGVGAIKGLGGLVATNAATDVPPVPVNPMRVTKMGHRQVALAWQPLPNTAPGEEYFVYRYYRDEIEFLGTSTDGTFIDKTAISNSAYMYAVGALGNFEDEHFVFANTPMPKVGDTDGDGSVNIIDLSIQLRSWDKTGTWDEGNFNRDTIINIDDLSLLLRAWTD